MAKFTKDQIKAIETDLECHGFEDAILNETEGCEILMSDPEIKKSIEDVFKTYQELEYKLSCLSKQIRNKGIETFHH